MGENGIKWIHIFNIMLAVAIVVLVGVLGETAFHFNSDPAYSKATSTIRTVDDNWAVVDDSGYFHEFDDFGRRLKTNEITLSRIFIFDPNDDADALTFKSYYSAVEVYQDGVLIYTHGNADDARKGTLLGTYVCVVPLETRYGEASEIEVHFVSSLNTKVNNFYFGSTEECVSQRFTKSLITTLFSFIMIVVAIVMLAFAFIGRKRLRFSLEYYYFVAFIVVTAIWAITDIQVLSAFGLNSGIICILSYECFSFMGIPLMVYMYYSCRRMKVLDVAVAIMQFTNFLVVNVLHFTKLLNFVQSVLSTQILIGVSLIVVTVQSLYAVIKDKDAKSIVMCLSIILVAIGTVIQLIGFYGVQNASLSDFLAIGITLFVILQVGSLFSGVFELVDEGRKAEAYFDLAKTDPLTGLGNRRGLDLFISEVAKSPTPFYRLGCIVCDLNDLKKTNDVYGHDAGDRLIKDFANCLQVCFENRGKVFRTGGDEFYIMFSDVEVDMSAMMRRLSICLDGSNSTAEYKISCSRGCYADYVAANNEDAVWDIIKFADAEMYKMKKADRDRRRSEEPSSK